MATFWEMYNYKYTNNYELEKTEDSLYGDDCEILIEIDGEYYECRVGDLEDHDGKLVLEVDL